MTEPTPESPAKTTEDGSSLNPEDALAVNALPDEVRHAAGDDETEDVQRNDGAVVDLEGTDEATAD
ncbi:hypothetical protein ASD11_10050 [Aeromicrobium sp. Root495]|uniref:hypothetical protein n=1 Tax=Aeromicrobium sp. Root495 TaxID=1736550 RepID=UPI0006FEE0D8|nr:hypothetical protein [Aeromicrobium sp. Root495]KQY59855.1 hypothetical protein ASD11_10050 [Aeromicrobium sp. Root495]RYJ03892.1 MAG: hypothetical protein EON52_17175 [Actinomycetales bacterium]